VKALIDDLLVLDVVVREDTEQHHADDDESGYGGFYGRVGKVSVKTLAAGDF
jgi:hypothetical protein